MKMQRLIWEHLEKCGIIDVVNDRMINTIEMSDEGILLTGSKLGYVEMVDYIISVALSNPGEHIHLDGYGFFENDDMEMIIGLGLDLFDIEKSGMIGFNGIVRDYLYKKGIIDHDIYKNGIGYLKIHGKEVMISCNKEGLIILSDYILRIALSESDIQIQLDEKNFFHKADAKLVIKLNELTAECG